MIEVKSLVKVFDGFAALDGLNMNVPDGSIYGLVGPNGAGKTTVLRHITGIYRQNAGEVLVNGEPVFENVKLKSRIAYIPDDIYFFLQAGIRDMMRFYRGVYPGFDMNRYDKLRDVFELDEKLPLRRMSKGMQKQAAFWLAISMRPDILILDEPVDGLDPVMRRQIWSIIMGDVAENGTTVLISSHNLRELEDVCDRVGIINKGKTMLEQSLDNLQESIQKVQFVYPEGCFFPEGCEVLHKEASGKIQTYIVRGSRDAVASLMEASKPTFYELIPLTLEEIFIHELGGADYAVKNILF